MNFWKQEPHLIGLLLNGNRERPHRTFLQKFFEGRDENAVLPASPNV
jgi:NADH dehydrogenase (ubiquinone) 1 alpha subcomplex subunit 6